ncbi:MAG: FtsK/SpoIIIE family protein [Bacteriovoracaceae bacterium]|nr:FtsK/SpoIIIE family protein [Bacteriovoracaceae bacterium]
MKAVHTGNALSKFGRGIVSGFSITKKTYRYYVFSLGLLTGLIVGAEHWKMHLPWLRHVSGRFLATLLGVTSGCSSILLTLFFLGLIRTLWLSKYQNAFKAIGLKNSLGEFPIPISSSSKPDRSEMLLVKTNGIGIDKFKEKIRDLESALGLGIDHMETGQSPSFVKISLYGSALPRVLTYEKIKEALILPYSFIVGQSAREVLTQSILTLPHMIIAGTTGGGKSIFFKATNLSLLTSSPHIQMYLFDLKGGVEMSVFSCLPNVQVYKNETDSIMALKALNIEMNRRLKYLTEKGFSKVDFERDKLDMIVAGVDEASELYGKSSNKKEQVLIEEARELTDRLTKLARATGIHVILATQKILKETIDTKIQENIGGRMVFRMNTLPGSMNVLGNKMALELPDIPGRAIWTTGNKFTEVQAPLLSEEDLKRALLQIKEDFEEGMRKNFEPMLAIMNSTVPIKTEEIKMFRMTQHDETTN